VHQVDLDRVARRLLWVCVACELLLVAADVVFQLGHAVESRGIRRLFNLARESTIATWFGATQAVLVGLTLFAIALAHRARGASRWTVAGWIFIGLFFVFVAMDDSAEIHERVGLAIKQAFAQDAAAQPAWVRWVLRFDNFGWQMFLMPLFGAMGLFMFVFVFRELRAHRLLPYFLAGLGMWVVAVALDFVDGIRDAEGRPGGVYATMARGMDVQRYTLSHVSRIVEEFLEMLGTTMFGYAFLRYLGAVADGLEIRFARTGTESSRNEVET